MSLPKTKNIVSIPWEAAAAVMQQTKYCGKYLTKKTTGYNTHTPVKYYGLYFLLKSESTTGCISDYNSQAAELASRYNISVRSFYNYVKELLALEMITREGKNLRLAAWSRLEEILDIDTTKRITVKYEYGTQKIHWWIAAIEIRDNQGKQAYMVNKKVKKNPDILLALLPELKKDGFDVTRLNEPEHLAHRLKLLALKSFQTGTAIHNTLITIRGDVNRSCTRIGKAWAMSPQLAAYYKLQMQKHRIIDVAKVEVESKYSYATKECHKNRFCHVIYDRKKKERVWFLCDQITVLFPLETKENFQIPDAA